jgi:energy-coupling factor transport system permease protein
MDARGYGRRVPVNRSSRWIASSSTAVGLLLVVVGVYGVLDSGSLPVGGIPFLAVGAALVGAGMTVGGRRTARTRYRPDLWQTAEWLVSASGAVVVTCFIVATLTHVAGMQLSIYPLRFPTLPLLPTLGILVGLLPAAAAPAPPRMVAPVPRQVEAVAHRTAGHPEGSAA